MTNFLFLYLKSNKTGMPLNNYSDKDMYSASVVLNMIYIYRFQAHMVGQSENFSKNLKTIVNSIHTCGYFSLPFYIVLVVTLTKNLLGVL